MFCVSMRIYSQPIFTDKVNFKRKTEINDKSLTVNEREFKEPNKKTCDDYINQFFYTLAGIINPLYSTNEKKRISILTQIGILPEFAEKFASYNREQYKKVIELLQYGLDEFLTEEALSFPPERYNKALTLLEKNINDQNLTKLSNLNNKKFTKAIDGLNGGIDADSVVLMSDCNKKQTKNAHRYMREGYTPNVAVRLAKLNKRKKTEFLNLLNQNISVENAIKIVQRNSKYQNKCLEMIKNGTDENYVMDFINLDETGEKRLKELRNLKVDDINIGDILSLPENSYANVIKLLKEGVSDDYVYDINQKTENTKDKENDEFFGYLNKGYGYNSSWALYLLADEEKEALEKFLKKMPKIEKYFKKNYDIQLVDLQNQDGIDLLLSKEYTSEDGKSKTYFVDIIDETGKILKNKYEENEKMETFSRLKNSDNVFEIKYGKTGIPEKIIKVINSKNTGDVQGVLVSKTSELLKGCYERTYYDISNFPENENYFDLDCDFNSYVPNGVTGATVKTDECGNVIFDEKLSHNGFLSERHYKEKRNNNGDIEYSEYSYKIKNPCGKKITDVSNIQKRNNDGSLTNIINGRKYEVTYDDKNKTVVIKSGLKTKKLNFENILAKYSKNTLWDVVKTLDVDTLVSVAKYVKNWTYCNDMDSSATEYTRHMATGSDVAVIQHEIGHFKGNRAEKLQGYEDLKRVYTREMNAFKESIPHNEQEFIEYFSPRADLTESDSLSEFIAETNMILSSYGCGIGTISTRSQFLVEYFPETISMISNLIDKNSKSGLI